MSRMIEKRVHGFYIYAHEDVTVVENLCASSYSDYMGAISVISETFPYKKRLWDHRFGEYHLTAKETIDLTLYGASVFGGGTKSVTVTRPDQVLAFGTVREAIGFLPDIDVEAAVFNDFNRALGWLDQINECSMESNLSSIHYF